MKHVLIVLSILFALSFTSAHAAAPLCGAGETGRTLTAPWSLTSDKQPPALTITTSNARVLSVTRATTSITVQACVSTSALWSISVTDGTQSAAWSGGTAAQLSPGAPQVLAPPARHADITK